jgi:valyl-tRNA synthetase
LYDFIWDDFCDWYVELVKPRLYRPEKPRERKVAQNILVLVLKDILKMLHPFMPFITEEIFQHLPQPTASIMIEPWPDNERFYRPQAEEDMRLLIQVIRAIRNIRNEFNIPPGMKIPVQVVTADTEKAAKIMKNQDYAENMANLKEITVGGPQEKRPLQALSAYLVDIEILVPVEGVIDVEKEIRRLKKELQATEQDIKRLESKLSNQGFISKAPAEVVEREKARQKENLEKREGIVKRLQTLNG